MTPIVYFRHAWSRCDEIKTLHVYLEQKLTSAISLDELLRAEWAARVSALDLFIHELVAQNFLAIFEGRRPQCPGYGKFLCTTDTLMRVKNAPSFADASAAVSLDVRTKLERTTYQLPESIAGGVRLISDCELWNEVALRRGATPVEKSQKAKDIKRELSLVIERRNKIVHEGDLQPVVPRTPWPITRGDVDFASKVIKEIVDDINAIV